MDSPSIGMAAAGGDPIQRQLARIVREIRKLGEVLTGYVHEESKKALGDMKSYIGNVSHQKEEDMAWKLAELLEGKVIVTGYILKDEDNQPITDIDAMVVGTWNHQEVVVFLEAKQFLKSNGQCRMAMNQLDKVSRYWEELTSGDFEDFSEAGAGEEKESGGSNSKYTAYQQLQVQRYGDRDVLFAIGADMYSPSAQKYFQRIKRRPLLLISDPAHKYVQLVL